MKIEEQVLSREQMAHLKELGVATSDASMAWFMSPKTKQWKIKVKNNFSHELLLRLSPERYIPAYTIGDLIEKLPKRIWYGDCPYDNDIDLFNSCVLYENWIGCEINHTLIKTRFDDGRLIDGLYSTLCNLYENHKELIK